MQVNDDCSAAGAAGNFLCLLERLSFNAFKTVMEIDTLGTFNVSKVIFDKYMKVNSREAEARTQYLPICEAPKQFPPTVE